MGGGLCFLSPLRQDFYTPPLFYSVRVSALNERAVRNIEFGKIKLRCSSLMYLVKAPIQPKPSQCCKAGLSCHRLAQTCTWKDRTKTSRLFLRKRCQPRAQQDDLTPSTLVGHWFGKGTLSRLKRCCLLSVRHLLSIPGLGGETLGEIAGETIVCCAGGWLCFLH